MADTHHMLLYHFVFSTKGRRQLIAADVRGSVFDYIGGTVRGLEAVPIRVGGWLDHVHILAKLRTTHCVADFMRELKANTSRHFNETTRSLHKFGWQDGYGAFTVSAFSKERLIEYIDGQEEHHRQQDSRAEYLQLLDVHGVEYDLKYVDD